VPRWWHRDVCTGTIRMSAAAVHRTPPAKGTVMATSKGRTTYQSEVPGIVVVEGAPAPTARILGTGLEVG